MKLQNTQHSSPAETNTQLLFDAIASDLVNQGYSIQLNALAAEITADLFRYVKDMPVQQFERAGVGREQAHQLNHSVRSDQICWIANDFDEGRRWLQWAGELQDFLNRRLFLGLFSFESHFSHYRSGDFYQKHSDAFKGESNRILSLVYYLNPEWVPSDGGELVLYPINETDPCQVTPSFGTLVIFLSEEMPHEVLKSHRDRYSIAGWYRVNTSTSERIDPPS
ncbi:MAG: SM-20-related protein [Candidatus Endobugula sp.]